MGYQKRPLCQTVVTGLKIHAWRALLTAFTAAIEDLNTPELFSLELKSEARLLDVFIPDSWVLIDPRCGAGSQKYPTLSYPYSRLFNKTQNSIRSETSKLSPSL